MSELHLTLPYPPSANHYWRRVGNRTLISRSGRIFRKRVCAMLASIRIERLAGPLIVDVAIHPPDRRRRDIDNVLKALLDALQHGGAYHDDSQIVRLAIEKRSPIKEGKTLVCIRQHEVQSKEPTTESEAAVPAVPEKVLVDRARQSHL